MLFCEIHDLFGEIISVSEQRMNNCIVKTIDNVFQKLRRWVISFKNRGFWTFFTIQVGVQKLIDFRRCDKRDFAGECTDFKIHRNPMLSFNHNML